MLVNNRKQEHRSGRVLMAEVMDETILFAYINKYAHIFQTVYLIGRSSHQGKSQGRSVRILRSFPLTWALITRSMPRPTSPFLWNSRFVACHDGLYNMLPLSLNPLLFLSRESNVNASRRRRRNSQFVAFPRAPGQANYVI